MDGYNITFVQILGISPFGYLLILARTTALGSKLAKYGLLVGMQISRNASLICIKNAQLAKIGLICRNKTNWVMYFLIQ